MSVRRSVYLADDQDRALADESRRIGASISQLIRRAVERCYGSQPPITPAKLAERLESIPMPDEGFADDLEAIQAAQPLAGKPEWPS